MRSARSALKLLLRSASRFPAVRRAKMFELIMAPVGRRIAPQSINHHRKFSPARPRG
jgi:hypothetical protein